MVLPAAIHFLSSVLRSGDGGGEDEEGNLYVTHATANYGGPVDPYQGDRGALWKILPADKVPKGAVTAPLQAK